MQADDIRLAEQFVLFDAQHSDFGRSLPGQILTPRNDLHIQSLRHASDRATNPAKTDNPERPSEHLPPNAALPQSRSQATFFLGDTARSR